MKENVSVEAGKCCTRSLNQTFRSVIRRYSFFASVRYSRIWANSLCRPARHVRGGFLCTEGSHRETRYHWYPQTAWENPSL